MRTARGSVGASSAPPMRANIASSSAYEYAVWIARETSSNGVRARRCQKYILTPSKKSVETPYGPIAVKCAEGFGISHAKPEYDAVAAVAREKGLPFREVWEAALAALREAGSV